MSNYIPVEYHQATGHLKTIYDEICDVMNLDSPPNWATYLGSAPNLVDGMWSMLKQVVIKSRLPVLLKELIFFAIAHQRTVPYCMELHATNIFRLTNDLVYQDLVDIVQGNSHGVIPESYKAAISLATTLCESSCSLSKRDFSELRNAGYNTLQAMEIATIVSAAVYFNILTFAADLPMPLHNNRRQKFAPTSEFEILLGVTPKEDINMNF